MKKKSNSSSQYLGVYSKKSDGRWSAEWRGKYLGSYSTEREALNALNVHRIMTLGENVKDVERWRGSTTAAKVKGPVSSVSDTTISVDVQEFLEFVRQAQNLGNMAQKINDVFAPLMNDVNAAKG